MFVTFHFQYVIISIEEYTVEINTIQQMYKINDALICRNLEFVPNAHMFSNYLQLFQII